jgi:hypothetical protein
MLTQVYRAIQKHFAHWEDATIGPEQLDEACITLKREALTCANREQFSLLLMAFLARLNNGHTRWRDPTFEAHPPSGMRLRPLAGRWTVVASDIAELRAGDVILDIAGKPIETWYSDLQRYLTGSPQSRTVQFGDRNSIFPAVLGLCLPASYPLTFEDAYGFSRTLSVDHTALAQDNAPRAILIGEPSGGSTGQPYFHMFENGLQFSIGAQRVRMPDGTPFEGVGLIPDINVNVQRADLYAGRDPVLEKAVSITETTNVINAPPI